MKRLLVLLPLLLTACSSVQLKREPKHEATLIHIQPYPYESHIPAFVCRDDKETAVIADWLREEDLGHLVTVYYVHNGYSFSAEGKLLQFNDDRVKLLEHVELYFTALGTAYPLDVNEYIHTDEIEFVLVEGNGEAH